jgi:DNA-binding transcriptional MerR regulator
MTTTNRTVTELAYDEALQMIRALVSHQYTLGQSISRIEQLLDRKRKELEKTTKLLGTMRTALPEESPKNNEKAEDYGELIPEPHDTTPTPPKKTGVVRTPEELRRRLGLSITDFSRKLGVTRNTVVYWSSRNPKRLAKKNHSKLRKLAGKNGMVFA